jgi:phage/plasmid-associated DNA primase
MCGNETPVGDYITKWIAQMLQYPAIKTISPTFIGEQGTGKTSVVKIIECLIGKAKCMETTNPGRDVWGEFSSLMLDASLVNLNEISKKNTMEAEGRLKGLQTDGKISINKKGLDQMMVNSYHRFLITSLPITWKGL